MAMPTIKERLTRLETEMQTVRADTTETKADVKKLVAAHERQRGAAKLLALLWAGLLTLGGVLAGIFTGGQHHG